MLNKDPSRQKRDRQQRNMHINPILQILFFLSSPYIYFFIFLGPSTSPYPLAKLGLFVPPRCFVSSVWHTRARLGILNSVSPFLGKTRLGGRWKRIPLLPQCCASCSPLLLLLASSYICKRKFIFSYPIYRVLLADAYQEHH